MSLYEARILARRAARDELDEAIYLGGLSAQREALLRAEIVEPITDTAGYLSCGCHCSQRDHTCRDTPEPREEDQ